MIIGSTSRPVSAPLVDEAPLDEFIRSLSQLPAEEWQKRISALDILVNAIPDYSTTSAPDEDGSPDCSVLTTPSSSLHRPTGDSHSVIPWYRSSRSVRRLSMPLKTFLLDARSAVVKEATELIGTLMMVKLQPHPSTTEEHEEDDAGGVSNGLAKNGLAGAKNNNEEDLFNLTPSKPKNNHKHPPPAFVGRLLFKDLIPAILQLSAQTVRVIRNYGVSMTLDILPHCRVKSILVILLERMKSDKNRSVREDCARYLRCVLESWPWDPKSDDSVHTAINKETHVVNNRKEESLTLESARQVGNGVGRALSDPAQPVRNEAKRGFQVLFQRFRPVWEEVMNAGVIRDVRLRKNLLDTASRSDGNIFEDIASVDDMSYNSLGRASYTSLRSDMSRSFASYASRGMHCRPPHINTSVPLVIGPGSSPSYLRGTVASAQRVTDQQNIHSSTPPQKVDYSVDTYVTTSGQVLSKRSPKSPCPRNGKPPPPKSLGITATTAQPFASLLRTPQQNHSTPSRRTTRQSPDAGIGAIQKSSKALRKRLSCRITKPTESEVKRNQLSRINEVDDAKTPLSTMDAHSKEIANVALEVIAAHKLHLNAVEPAINKEKEIILDLEEQSGVSILNGMRSERLGEHLASLSEEEVCDYFGSVHVCVDKQRIACEMLLKEMERISQGDELDECLGGPCTNGSKSTQTRELAQSPMIAGEELEVVQKDLKDAFLSPTSKSETGSTG